MSSWLSPSAGAGADDNNGDDRRMDSVELWMLESALGLNRASALKSGRPQRLYHVLRRIRVLQRALGQHRGALRAWAAELRDLLRLAAPGAAGDSIDTFHDLIGVVACILGSFQLEDGPRPASLSQAQSQWLQRAHDLLVPGERRRRRPPPPQPPSPPTPPRCDTSSSGTEDDDDDDDRRLPNTQPLDNPRRTATPSSSSRTASGDDDDDPIRMTTTAPIPLERQIRDQIPKLRHVDPHPEYQPPVALGVAVVGVDGGGSALRARLRAQKARLRSVPTRVSCVQVGRVIAAISQRSRSATRASSSSEAAATPDKSPSGTTTPTLSLRLGRAATTTPGRSRLGRRGRFEQMGAVERRQIRSPSVRLPSSRPSQP